jgi:transposase
MGRPKKVRAPLPPIWRLSDEQWTMVEPVLAEHDPPAEKGPDRVDQRAVMDAVIFRMRTGCQWNRLPQEYPDDSTVHRHFQRWVERGVFKHLWGVVQEVCEDLCEWADTTPPHPQPQHRRSRFPPGRLGPRSPLRDPGPHPGCVNKIPASRGGRS